MPAGLLESVVFCGQPALARSHDKGTAEPADLNFADGMKRIRDRDYEGGADSFLQAVYFSRNHYNPEAYKYLGLCYKAMRQNAKAVEALTTHLKQVTEPAPDARIDLAEVYLNMGEFDKARASIDQAYVDAGGHGTYRQKYAMGELYEKMKDFGQALGFYDSAIEEKNNFTDAWMGKARIEVLLEKWNDALKDYREILERGPGLAHVNYEETYYNMGTCLYKRGDHQGAIDHWRLALQDNPDSFDAHLSLGKIFDEEKHISSAVHEYELALRNAPKGYNPTIINKRLQYLEALVKPKEAAPVIKPSPQMRQEYEESLKRRGTFESTPNLPPAKDSGF